MNKIKNILLFICSVATALIFSSCEKEAGGLTDNQPPEVLVVEGRFTNDPSFSYIKLSLPVRNQEDEVSPASGAVVNVDDGVNNYVFTESPSEKGVYYTTGSGEAGKKYRLHINYGNKDYYASDTMKQVNAGFSLAYSSIPGTSYFRLLWLYPQYNQTDAFQYEIDIIRPDSGDTSRLYYYTLTTIDVSSIFRPVYEQVTFPSGTAIMAKKMSMSDNYETFIRSLLLETQWSGGLFDAQKANPETNLSEGATGYFSTSYIKSDSVLVK